MTLFGKVLRLPDDIVSTIINGRDKRCSLLINDQFNPVAYSHRISATNTLQAEVAFYFRLNQLAIVCTDGVPAASIFDDEAFHPTPS